jgi:hypothetical protein
LTRKRDRGSRLVDATSRDEKSRERKMDLIILVLSGRRGVTEHIVGFTELDQR